MSDQSLLTWHGDPALKADTIARLIRHRDTGTFTQFEYRRPSPTAPDGFCGCALGVAALTNLADDFGWHVVIEHDLGIPCNLANMIDRIFTDLSLRDAPQFAVDVFTAIPVGVDLVAQTESLRRQWLKAHDSPESDAVWLVDQLATVPMSTDAP